MEIAIYRSSLPEKEGSYYWCDLMGMEVYDDNQVSLGIIIDVYALQNHDVIVMSGDRSLPFTKDFIKDVSLIERKVIVYSHEFI